MPIPFTDPRENEDYALIEGDSKHVRCLHGTCGALLPRKHKTRLRAHFSGRGKNVAKCMHIPDWRRAAFVDYDVYESHFVETAPGFVRCADDRARKFMAYYAHDAAGLNVQCMWCDKRFRYHEGRMRDHLLGGSRHIAPCSRFTNREVQNELISSRLSNAARADLALKLYVSRRLVRGDDPDTLEAWYHDQLTSELIGAFASLPADRAYRLPAYEQIAKQDEEEE